MGSTVLEGIRCKGALTNRLKAVTTRQPYSVDDWGSVGNCDVTGSRIPRLMAGRWSRYREQTPALPPSASDNQVHQESGPNTIRPKGGRERHVSEV